MRVSQGVFLYRIDGKTYLINTINGLIDEVHETLATTITHLKSIGSFNPGDIPAQAMERKLVNYFLQQGVFSPYSENEEKKEIARKLESNREHIKRQHKTTILIFDKELAYSWCPLGQKIEPVTSKNEFNVASEQIVKILADWTDSAKKTMDVNCLNILIDVHKWAKHLVTILDLFKQRKINIETLYSVYDRECEKHRIETNMRPMLRSRGIRLIISNRYAPRIIHHNPDRHNISKLAVCPFFGNTAFFALNNTLDYCPIRLVTIDGIRSMEEHNTKQLDNIFLPPCSKLQNQACKFRYICDGTCWKLAANVNNYTDTMCDLRSEHESRLSKILSSNNAGEM